MNIKRVLAAIIAMMAFCGALSAYESGSLQCAEPRKALPFHKGERLIYDVYCKNIKLGESVLIFHGEEDIDGKRLYRVTFNTALHAFEDNEDIYAYKETFLPFKISRKIKKVNAFSTTILEEYDQEAFKVKIRNRGTILTRRYTINKKGPIHNALLLIYRYRTIPAFTKGENAPVILPSAEFDVALKGRENITTGLGECSAYVFRGTPSNFTFWLSVDRKRIPLKIKGWGLLDYSFVIKSIEDISG